MSDPTVSIEAFRNNAFIDAVKQSDLRPLQKLNLRGLYLVPRLRSAIDDYITELASAAGHDVSTMANGDLIKFIIEHLPEIIAFIELLIGLFG